MDMEYNYDKLPYGTHGFGTLGVEGQYDELEFPLALQTALAQDAPARARYCALRSEQRVQAANYICAVRGEEQARRIAEVLAKLRR